MSGDIQQLPVNRNIQNRDSYWFAHQGANTANSTVNPKTPESKDAPNQKEREERIRQFREQQEEERIKKMQELEESFVLSRKYREQQEEERRRKIYEARSRERERRYQVEERKLQIWEAEQERKEAILRRNMEREARIEARRNAQRNSMCFAFGSSTPRTFDLDLAALGRSGCPLMSSVSGRRSEERDFASKRATSVNSLDRKPGDDCMSWSTISLSSATRGRRRTDLLPVTPRERSTTPNSTPRASAAAAKTPSRPVSSMSGRSEVSLGGSSQASAVSLRPKPAPRRPRPISIAGSIVDRTTAAATWNTTYTVDRKPRAHDRNGSEVRVPRAKSSEPEELAKKLSSVKKPVPPPKSAQVLAKARIHPVPTKDNLRKNVRADSKPGVANKTEDAPKIVDAVHQVEKKQKPVPPPKCISPIKMVANISEEKVCIPPISDTSVDVPISESVEANWENKTESPVEAEKSSEIVTNPDAVKESNAEPMQTKPRITSEEEARVALAEKRRLAREQAEKEAEMERERQRELERQEEERRIQEELEQKRLEEEQNQLAELHRKLEEEKLKKAIEEQRQREEEEQQRREEETRLKAEREEQERKAREEAERQRLEMEEKLRKEEEERAERKKRVQQIMSRTRGKGSQSVSNLSSPSEVIAGRIVDVGQSEEETQNAIDNSNVIMNNGGTHAKSNHENNVNNISKPSVEPFDNLMEDLVRDTNVKNGLNGGPQNYLNTNSVPNRTSIEDSAYTSQTNGYSSHEDMSITSSPEERSEQSDSSEALLLDLQPSQHDVSKSQQQCDMNQLIDISSSTQNDNYVIDVVNSNLMSQGNPFLAYDRNIPKKQESITDLLS